MAKQQKNNPASRERSPKDRPPTRPHGAEAAAPTAPSINVEPRRSLGLLFLLVSIVASGFLVAEHLVGMSLPGCGVGSGCAQVTRGPWGTIPGLGWPVSSVGLAYFISIAIGWMACRGAPPPAFKWLVRIGVLISIGFIILMIAKGTFCWYCFAAHAGNLAFWLVGDSAPRSERRSLASLATVAAVFAVSTAGIAGVQAWQRGKVKQRADADLAESTREIIERSTTTSSSTQPAGGAASANLYSPEGGFTGRWRRGPETAPVRIVIISDYQCQDCRDIDRQVSSLLLQRKDVSVSNKHYPFCTDCNKYLGRANMHPNACWAARAAETAGILGGNEGFWRMHDWLFSKSGGFTDAELNGALPGLGFNAVEFNQVMQSETTLDPVLADIDEAMLLGLHFTPMIFINGVELRGFINNPNAISNAVASVMAANPPPGTAKNDRPPLALEKLAADWRVQRTLPMPTDPPTWPKGPADAKVHIDVWADAQFAFMAEIDQHIRKALESRGDVRYTFHSFPLDKTCNPNTRVERVSPACWVAAAHEAAGQLGGVDAYWKVHDWIVANQKTLTDEALLAAAPGLGLDGAALIASIKSPEVQAAVLRRSQAAGPYVHKGMVPTIYVNGRYLPRWKMESPSIVILPSIIDEAGR